MQYGSATFPYGRSFGLRLDTLIRLRWLAVAGQVLALLVVHGLLGFPVPLIPCLLVVSLSALVNLLLRVRFPIARRLEDAAAGPLLAYDVLQLTALLYLTGGLNNPFALLYLAPVTISATALSWSTTVALGVLAMGCAGAVGLWHQPLPWSGPEVLALPDLYLAGTWVSIAVSIGFIGLHSWRVTEEARELADALAATELVLAREQHLSQLDGLAAAAAHELGTPLATIALVVKEMARGTAPDHPMAEDIALLRDQVQRCRDILQTLTSLGSGDAPFDRMPLSLLLEEVVGPHRDFGIYISVTLPEDRTQEPVLARNPGLIYGLGNLVENAVDFATARVEIEARWTTTRMDILVRDDGPGFSPEVSDRIGQPYVTSRARDRQNSEEESGLGLGFFIAKTLLERTGAALVVENRAAPGRGAEVKISWLRNTIEMDPEDGGTNPPPAPYAEAKPG
ncbi:MAG: two-component sensor histidine kinase [Rhizobiales bacterium 24-66-13]|jgi:two-component system sensor histidine kinase RegB|uniref:ActS/PrrB/RegB family redox-sensitive histidine kinase n=1 Tax=Roseixanthobacter finlandensis TaxID=3119922 RepID=UPI000BCEF246|nr:MAG: two-component sensor histidine kinase [Rhizobiales bacterium 12-66-7]OYZ69496.1 MAG: two-component sensor histidine kinase [Rhizobiales bacterium 24-66-13]OZB04502.1 MAG: two-component sensor histidine kinase [Rhizobiales bacterium 39-66-18]HQS08802.1 ActS/PrrB/RegB family redox-sensitive histidine kinase [Xanthobacteraceae bacterium]HQS45341.1 ActS/PrrB/RegB family redox-sensitive histidine kinase [Xanthobacteraceae bacterium]